jgi:hypothetical protein
LSPFGSLTTQRETPPLQQAAGGKLLTKPAKSSLVNDNPFPTPPDAGIDFVLPLSRPWSFVLWVKATHRITKKSTEFETTFNVSEP